MSADSPPLIGRSRAPSRALPLGHAVPTIGSAYRPRAERPAAKVEPKTTEQQRAEEAERRDAQPIVTRCGLCDFRFDGTVGEAREASRQHRVDAHPGLKLKKTKRDNLKSWRPQNDVEQKTAAMKTVMERRAFTERSERLREAGHERLGPDVPASPSRRPSPAQQSILRFLEDGPKRLCEIAEHQGTRPATNGKTLHRLAKRGLIVKQGHGLYELADAVRAEAA